MKSAHTGTVCPQPRDGGQLRHFLPQSLCLQWVGPPAPAGLRGHTGATPVRELAGLPHPRRGLTMSVILPPPDPTPEGGGPGPGVGRGGRALPPEASPWRVDGRLLPGSPQEGPSVHVCVLISVRTPVAGIRATSFQLSPLRRPRLQGWSHPEGLGSGLKTGMWGTAGCHSPALTGFALRGAPASSAVPKRCLQLPPPRRRDRGR